MLNIDHTQSSGKIILFDVKERKVRLPPFLFLTVPA